MISNATATLEQVMAVPLIRPAHARSFWQGIKHSTLVEAVMDECHQRNWKIKESRFVLSRDSADLAGTFSLEINDVKLPKGQSLELGFLTSNMMRRKLKLAVGTRVHVCMNGMVTGDEVLCNKHTSGFDLFEALEGGMDRYHAKALEIPKVIHALESYELAPMEVEHILMDAGRKELMPWSRIGQVDAEYKEATYAELNVKTSWGLLNAFTHIVKKCPALGQIDQINGFRQLLPTGKN